ncbi:MAG: response regulator transcription factor [Methylococcales bacterium]|nr:response regulator transcription factor [Methylococcales bacterium]
MRILVVEDEKILCQQIQNFFVAKRFVVDCAYNGEDGYYLATEFPIDAAIIDIGLPDISGMELIKRLRTQNIDIPILLLTARTRWQDKVKGLEAGADDYLSKPFHYEELEARINALIRRSMGSSQPILNYKNIKLDTLAQIVSVNDKVVDLTAFEYKVLEYLMFRRGEIISKAVLTDHIYEEDFDRDSNVIEVFVGRLRKKIDPKGITKPIETLRGRGYRISNEI